MFGNKLKDRVESLERDVAKLNQDRSCSKGLHKWVISSHNGVPRIICENCYAQPKEQSHDR